jgi:hypothetical protein
MRRYMRHPANMPIDFHMEESDITEVQRVKDVSQGGLCFVSDKPLRVGARIRLTIPVGSIVKDSSLNIQLEPYEASGSVAWCREKAGQYEVGVEFSDASTLFGVRMVEQVCHIEHYRQDMLIEEGRVLSSEEAAQEWVQRYAPYFPQ